MSFKRSWKKRALAAGLMAAMVGFGSQTFIAPQQAEAKADELLRNAEYLKQKRINEATEQVAMFEAMYKEYSQNPGITRSRMYYEAISEALPDVKVYIDTSGENGVQKVLPLKASHRAM